MLVLFPRKFEDMKVYTFMHMLSTYFVGRLKVKAFVTLKLLEVPFAINIIIEINLSLETWPMA